MKIIQMEKLPVHWQKLTLPQQEYVSRVARGADPVRVICEIHEEIVSGEQAQTALRAYRNNKDVTLALAEERLSLSERGCVSRAEKRHVLSSLIRESGDADVVLKAIQTDNRMTGDEIAPPDASKPVFVIRASDVVDVAVASPTDCIG